MKLRSITIRNFKRFVAKQKFEFFSENDPDSNKILILGNNGTGKSSILQAIVLITALATRDRFTPEDVNWPGFDFRHAQIGKMPIAITCDYLFSDEEVSATRKYAERLIVSGIALELPSTDKEVSLRFNPKNDYISASKSKSRLYQFSGYQYAKQLSKNTKNKSELFDKVGNIYWYDEQRTSASTSNMIDSSSQDLDDVRAFLSSAYTYHIAVTEKGREIREGEFDFYESIHTLYRKVFPSRSFIGSAPRFDVYEKADVPDFFLFDGKNQYELGEMSAGERAVFPILMDFARWNINNSIIIIDEIELHLHPPLQQALIRVLDELGNDNQFIITSHSNSVAAMFDEAQIIRL